MNTPGRIRTEGSSATPKRSNRFPFRSALVRHALMFCLLLTVSAASVWPVTAAPASLIPTTEYGISTVPLFNAWTIVWNADRLQQGLSGYWNAPIFFPARGTFAFSEPQPATMFVAPVFWLTGSPALAYNVYLIVSLTLNGWFSIRLLRRMRLRWLSSVAGGVAMVLHPMVHGQGDVLQLMGLWPVIWTLTALFDLQRAAMLRMHDLRRQRKLVLLKGIETGLAFACVFAVAIHHGLFLTLLAAGSVWVLIPWRRLGTWSRGAVAGLVLAVTLLAPLLFPVFQILRDNQFDREEALVGELSARWSDILLVAPTALIRFPAVTAIRPWYLLPGVLRFLFALLALTVLWRKRNQPTRPMLLFLLLIGIESLVFSLGTNLTLGEWKPWLTLSQWCPGFSQVRSAFRFGYFFQMSVILLCSAGFDSISRWLLHTRPRWSRGVTCLLAGVGLLLAFEVPPSRVKVVGVPDLSRVYPWQEWLHRNVTPGKGVVFLPYVAGKTVEQFDLTVRWMLRTTPMQIPILNGYSGFFPEAHYTSQKLLNKDPFSTESLDHLWMSGVQYLVVQGPGIAPGTAAYRVELVYQDESEIMIYSLLARF